jgi:hypothetical protein
MWKPGDLDRRKAPPTDAVRERRRAQQNSWFEGEHDRRVRRFREEHHDAHAKTIAPERESAGSVEATSAHAV